MLTVRKRLHDARSQAASIYKEHGFAELLRRIFVYRSRNGAVQFVRYGLVGLVAAAFDTGTLLFLANVLGVNYVVAGTAGFVLGTVVNYAISVNWVFERTNQPYIEMSLFALIGAAGLVVNDLTLWAGQAWFGMELIWAKIIAIVVGFLWNFILRKVLFDRLGAHLRRREEQRVRESGVQ